MALGLPPLLLLMPLMSSGIIIEDEHPIFITATAFLGVNIDAASLFQGTRLDFSDPDLRMLAKRLGGALPGSPMTLRLGGSSSDDLTWGDAKGQIAMTIAYWDALQDFVGDAGFHLAWDLNAMRSRNATSGTWDPTDATTLLKHVQSRGQSLWALQLGNEPGHFQTRSGGTPTPAEHGGDFLQLHALLEQMYGTSLDGRPRIQGPDVCYGSGTDSAPCASSGYLRELLAVTGPNIIDDLTVHSYGMIGPGKPGSQCHLHDFLDPEAWQQTAKIVSGYLQVRNERAASANLVLGETASAPDGGCPGLSNRFAAGFYFVDILGTMGELGVWQVYRQDLVGFSGINGGSSYSLAGPAGWHSRASDGRLTPHPDYFTALLWIHLMGPERLRVVASQSDKVRLHAACAVGGGVAVAYLNPTAAAREIHINVSSGRRVARGVMLPIEAYLLTAPEGNLTADTVLLNGKVLTAESALAPVYRTSPMVTVPAFSYGFVVDRAACVPACGSSPPCGMPRGADGEVAATHSDRLHSAQPVSETAPPEGCIRVTVPSADYNANSAAIQSALDRASKQGSRQGASELGCVVVSGGDYPVLSLEVRSHTRLVVSPQTRLLNVVNRTRVAVVHVRNARHVVIEGGGTIHGNAEHAWRFWSARDNRMSPYFDDGQPLRANCLLVSHSVGVTVRDLHLHNSTDWTFRMDNSSDIHVDNVDIYGDSRFPNNDGFDPQSCRNVTLTNSRIDVADDGICPKAQAGWGPLKGLYVHNVTIRSKSHAIKFGTNTDEGMSDVVFDNITIWDSNGGLSVQQRTGGDVTNVTWSNIQIETRYQAPRWWGNGEWLSFTNNPRGNNHTIGKVAGMRFVNISGRSENGGILSGLSGGAHDIHFENVHITIATWSNYSNGSGPVCYADARVCSNDTGSSSPSPPQTRCAATPFGATYSPGATLPHCMGSRDYRPTIGSDHRDPRISPAHSYYVRVPALADALYLENAHNVTFQGVHFEYAAPRRAWFGDCLVVDQYSDGIKGAEAIVCTNGPQPRPAVHRPDVGTHTAASRAPSAKRGATPMMGWNNCQVDCGVWAPDDELVRSTAVALNRSGLSAAGYTHLHLDDAWMSSTRAADGRLQPNASRFPNFTDTMAFVRSLGLQVGLYVAAGDLTCSGRAGSCQHEAMDAAQFVEWGIAHVKDDACSTCRDSTKKGAPADYRAMADGLLRAAGRHGSPAPTLMVEGQPPFPQAADGHHGNVRRVGHDINPSWLSMLSLVDLGSGLWPYANPGFFNELEMMELGNGDFVAEEGEAALARSRAHMTMWAVMKSPLILSTNLSALGPQVLAGPSSNHPPRRDPIPCVWAGGR